MSDDLTAADVVKLDELIKGVGELDALTRRFAAFLTFNMVVLAALSAALVVAANRRAASTDRLDAEIGRLSSAVQRLSDTVDRAGEKPPRP